MRVSGIASGLPPNLLEQVLEAERSPIKKMEADKNKIQEKNKLVTDLESKVNDIGKNLTSLMGRRGFVDKKIDSNFPDVINGTLDPDKAEAGNWNLEVIELASKSSVVSGGFPDKDKTTAGVGYIRFRTEDGEKDVYISDEADSTLEKIAEKINLSNVGVKAAVVNDVNNKDRGYKLELSSEKTGEDERVEFPVVYLLDGEEDLQFDQMKEPKNAKFKLDGHEFEAPDNLIKDALPGINIDLKQAKPGQTVRMNITENYDAIAEKIKGFVDSYNAALGIIQAQNKLTPNEKGDMRLGPLGGDSMTRIVEGKLREVIQSTQETGSPIKTISELGVEYTRNGTLNFKQDKLKKQVSDDPKAVVQFLRGNNVDIGFIPSVTQKLRGLADPASGAIGAKKQSFESRVKNIDDRIDRKERALGKREEQLKKQFSQMEQAMSQLQGQSGNLGAMAGPKG